MVKKHRIELKFLTQIKTKDPQISNFIKIHPMGAELFHAYGQTDSYDEANLIVAFRTFANVPKNSRNRMHVRCAVQYSHKQRN